jgi:hypothetical protein
VYVSSLREALKLDYDETMGIRGTMHFLLEKLHKALPQAKTETELPFIESLYHSEFSANYTCPNPRCDFVLKHHIAFDAIFKVDDIEDLKKQIIEIMRFDLCECKTIDEISANEFEEELKLPDYLFLEFDEIETVKNVIEVGEQEYTLTSAVYTEIEEPDGLYKALRRQESQRQLYSFSANRGEEWKPKKVMGQFIYQKGADSMEQNENVRKFCGSFVKTQTNYQNLWFLSLMYLELDSSTWWSDEMFNQYFKYFKLKNWNEHNVNLLVPGWERSLELDSSTKAQNLFFPESIKEAVGVVNENGHFTCFFLEWCPEEVFVVYFNSLGIGSQRLITKLSNSFRKEDIACRVDLLNADQPIQPDSDSCAFFVLRMIQEYLRLRKKQIAPKKAIIGAAQRLKKDLKPELVKTEKRLFLRETLRGIIRPLKSDID